MSNKKHELALVKEALAHRLGELEEKIKQMSSEQVSDDQVQDPGDQALTSTMETLRSSLQDSELQEYHRILRALEKIEDGSYGICSDCGENISEKRLSLYPNAARCLSCQEAFEDRRE